MEKVFLGIDVGSTTLKMVLMDDTGKVLNSLYKRTKPMGEMKKVACHGRCNECGACSLGSLKKGVHDFLQSTGFSEDDVVGTAVTGSQIVEDTKKFLHYDFHVSEVSAHVAGAKHYYPDCKAILDVGGQDSKAMIYNEQMEMWTSKMSGICAAGTGAFLDNVAGKLGVPVEELADKVNYDSDLEFSSVCAVLAATSINKFKNRFPLGQIIGGACRAQARTIMSGVGEILRNYKGDIIFQGGVAYNRAVAYYLKEITGNNFIVPEFHGVMGALGAACLAKDYDHLKGKLNLEPYPFKEKLKSIAVRSKQTRKEFFSRTKGPLVWRNLFYPAEILNALGVKMLTLETYSAFFARNTNKLQRAFDGAALKGFAAETCSFLRVLEGSELPKADFGVSTSQPCQQGERIFKDLIRNYNQEENFYSLHTPITKDESAVEHMAHDLEYSVSLLEKSLGIKMDMGRLTEACELSNKAQALSNECNQLRLTSPPLIRGGQAVYFASVFSQLWGRQGLIDLLEVFKNDLLEAKEKVEKTVSIEDTHRLLWLHLPPFYNSSLLDFIEIENRAPIVFEEVNYAGWTPLDPSDPYRSLARKLLTVGFLDPELRVKRIKENVAASGINGCILYNHMFGRCSMADISFQKHLREELSSIGVPLLSLDGDCLDATIDPCSTTTKISAYVDALNNKKFGNIFGALKR